MNLKTRFISWLADWVVIELARRQAVQMHQVAEFNAVNCTHGAIGMMTTDGPMISRDGGSTWQAPD